MSITKGIEIRRKNPSQDRPCNKRPVVSWKCWYEDIWFMEWLNTYESMEPAEYYKRLGAFEWEASVKKEDLLRMADDLINRRFNVCPEGYGYFKGDEDEENKMVMYGQAFKKLVDQLQDYEILVYYDYGN